MERLRRPDKKRPYKQGGFNRAMLRHRKYEEAAELADKELLSHKIGEPSPAFFPVVSEPELAEETGIIFDSSSVQEVLHEGRKADVAKRRADIINNLLENPADYPVTKSNLSFIERHFGRITRFARTLKHKGKLHPGIGNILEV